MNKLTPKIWHALFTWNTYSVVAQELTSDNEYVCKWAGLHVLSHYPEHPGNYWFIKESQEFKFCLIIFELDRRTVEYSDGIGSNEIKNASIYKLNSEEELYTVCENLSIEPDKFAPPWHSNYPFN